MNYKQMATHIKTLPFSQIRVPLQSLEPGIVTSFVISDGFNSTWQYEISYGSEEVIGNEWLCKS
jgi:hypothetical protein